MAKENFSWKGLFVNDDNAQNDTPKPILVPEKNQNSISNSDKFPTSTASPIIPNSTPIAENKFLAEILSVYENGFDTLNNEGFDFFELYKSVCAVGINNPQSYQMAFAMGKSLRPEITKQFLLDKSDYYISEIEKVHKNYDVIGNARNTELNNSVSLQKSNLTKEIETLQNQISALQNTLQSKVAELGKIDSDVTTSFEEIKLKIHANNEAKQKILESINTVVAGIKQYL